MRLALEQVEQLDAAAADLLKVCAFLQPEAIPEELLVTGAPFLGPLLEAVAAAPTQLDQALAALRRFSLVSRHTETHTLAIHRLVQAVIQDDLDPATRSMWSERVLRVVNATMPQGDFETWPESERSLPHALLCVARLEQEGASLPEAAELLYKTGSYLLERGRYLEAEPLLVQAVASCETHHGADHPLLVPFLVRLGALWHKRGNYEPAQATLQRAVSLVEQHLEPSHPQTAQALSQLGMLYWERGKTAEAVHVGQQALAIYEQHWGPDHPQTATALVNLASYWQEQGHYAEAEPLFLRALTICEQHVGADHPQTADTLNSLTVLYLDQRNAKLAALVGTRTLTIYEQHLGPEHPKTAMALNNLALAYRRQGQLTEALPLYQRSLAIAEQQLGPEHTHTATCMSNLANVYREQGQYAQAEALYQRALVIQAQRLGSANLQLGYTLNNLALLYQATGEYEQAEANAEQALRLREQELEGDHPLTATSLTTLANVYRAQGKLDQARLLYQRALAICEQRLGPDHPSTLQARKDAVSLEGDQAAPSPRECSVLSESMDECSVFDRSLGTRDTSQPSQISSLVLAFASVPDRRSDQGQRHPLAAVLALVTIAQLSGAKTLRAIARWGRGQPPEVVRALGFRGTRTPAVSTLHDALKTLDGAAFEHLLDAWVQQMLGSERGKLISQDRRTNGQYKTDLPGVRIIANYAPEIKQVLLQAALASPAP